MDDDEGRTRPEAGRVLCGCACDGAAAAEAAAVLVVMTTGRDAGTVLVVVAAAAAAVAADAANNEVAPSGMLAINWARFCEKSVVEKSMTFVQNNGM